MDPTVILDFTLQQQYTTNLLALASEISRVSMCFLAEMGLVHTLLTANFIQVERSHVEEDSRVYAGPGTEFSLLAETASKQNKM